MLIQLHKILDVSQCYGIVRSIRWQEGVYCPSCQSKEIIKNGKDSLQVHCPHYRCKSCQSYFDDLTDTLFTGSHQPFTQWITCLYLMNLNVSMAQIAAELELSEPTAQAMCGMIREGIVKKNLLYTLAEKLRLMNVISLPDIKDNQLK